jgi:DnaJ-class molecular chaperone
MNLRSIPALVGQFGGKGKTAMTKPQDQPTQQDKPKLSPGDVAAPGTPGTGENVCPDCEGSGQIGSAPCPACGGKGTVTEGIGGG